MANGEGPSGPKIYSRPNLKRWFVAEPGWLVFEVDLEQADAQVVAWDAHDEPLMRFFTELHDKAMPEQHSADCPCLHCFNCMTIFGDWSKHNRFLAKKGVHAANYDVSAFTLARSLGIKQTAAHDFLRRWFIAHPAIKDWQARIRKGMKAHPSMVRNAFGYRKLWHGRVGDHEFKEGYSWPCQSTVAEVINRGMKRVQSELPPNEVQLRMQVHDSLVGVFREELIDNAPKRILECTRIEVPYEQPLVIGREIKVGPSWGELEKWKS